MRIRKLGFAAIAALAVTAAGLFAGATPAAADSSVQRTCEGSSSCTITRFVQPGADVHISFDAIGGPNNLVLLNVSPSVDGGPIVCTAEIRVDDPPTKRICPNYPYSVAHVTGWDRSGALHDWDISAGN